MNATITWTATPTLQPYLQQEMGKTYVYAQSTSGNITGWFKAYQASIPVVRAIQAATDLHRLALACQFALLADRPDWHDDALPEQAPR